MSSQLLLGDVFELNIPKDSFYMAILDPPIDSSTSDKDASGLCEKIAKLTYKSLIPGSSCFFFCNDLSLINYVSVFKKAGFYLHDMFIWETTPGADTKKPLFLEFMSRNDMINSIKWDGWAIGKPRTMGYLIFWFLKPFPKLPDALISENFLKYGVGAFNYASFEELTGFNTNIIREAMPSPKLHPRHKPVKLLQSLIELTTQKKQIIFDPFCGIGTTAVAAIRSEREYFLVDTNHEYISIAESLVKKELDKKEGE